MTISYSATVRNAKLDAIETTISTAPELRITRLDKPISGVNRRTGPIAEQTWELLDIEGVSKAIIFVSYDCGGRYVTNKFVEVAL
jgi:hypothetical protein